MARKYVCKGQCGGKFPLEEMKQISNQNFCSACYEKIISAREARNELHRTIREIYNVSMPTGQMLKQIKTFEENGLTLKGMTLTLRYCKDIKKLDFNAKYGLSIITYYYEEAKQDFIEKRKRVEAHKDSEITTEVVVIRKIRSNKHKQSRLINMEAIV